MPTVDRTYPRSWPLSKAHKSCAERAPSPLDCGRWFETPRLYDVSRNRALVALAVHGFNAKDQLIDRRVLQSEFAHVARPDFAFPIRRGCRTDDNDEASEFSFRIGLFPAQNGVIAGAPRQPRPVPGSSSHASRDRWRGSE